MAENAGQSINKERKPYYGERKVKIGDPKLDQRKLRDMVRGASRKRGQK